MAKKEIISDQREAGEIKLVKMTRQEPQQDGGAVTADVHPDEVSNFKAAGWNILKD